ncbi:hypothetical protein J27TS8_11020 [Robertmurraya siralis]|uniref:Sin domain-containing protein n=1 Tax=Robertmurraya siralis TaxID=77777 RepID=A0A919WG44_9BACI|nr:anti-repressor SinI family protein [Robertmurraya siralis]PAE22496.1 hypothetical protein CHH80_00595 [Bacillus sp. 7504-2]GIN61109.1 hypothetical protein J27TS8_11020 [Robertmurraya siralis]
MEKVTEFEQSKIVIIPNKLDEEWLRLIIQAKRLGLTIDEVRNFLNSK